MNQKIGPLLRERPKFGSNDLSCNQRRFPGPPAISARGARCFLSPGSAAANSLQRP